MKDRPCPPAATGMHQPQQCCGQIAWECCPCTLKHAENGSHLLGAGEGHVLAEAREGEAALLGSVLFPLEHWRHSDLLDTQRL